MNEFNQNQNQNQAYCPSSNMVWAILCTLFCCLPLGIVAIIKASSVEKLWYQGRQAEAIKASSDARNYALWGAVASLIFGVLYVVLVVMGAMMA